MQLIDILVWVSIFMMCATMIFTYVGKKRIDRNEPPYGKKRKQFLAAKK